LPGGHLIQHHTKRKQITSCVQFIATHLFGNGDLRLWREGKASVPKVTDNANDGDVCGVRYIRTGGDLQECRRSNVNFTAVEDGERYLDYLGEVMSQLAKPGEAKIMVQPGYEFIVSEYDKFVAAKDEKLAERYGKLRGYYESRLGLWGLRKKS
jgi:hypothetical protein